MTTPTGPTSDTAEGGLDEPTELEPAQGSLALASPEDTAGRAEWEAATAAVLRKARRLRDDEPDTAVWERLTRTTLDGLAVAPIGTPEHVVDLPPVGAPGAAPFTRGRLPGRPEGGWDVRTVVGGQDAEALNELALLDLENGATSLWVEVGGPLAAADLPALLDGVFLDLAPVVLEAPADPLGAARALVAHLADLGVTPAEGTNLGVDPVGVALRGVRSPDSPPDSPPGSLPSADDVARVVTEAAELARSAGTLALVVDGTALHDRGASDAQELGYVLALGAAYLRGLTAAGLDVDDALGLLEFRLAATDEQFPTIAKLRAARQAWSRVAELSGASPEAGGMRQHVVTSRPMMSRYDPWVNMLRTTVAAFAAGVGGADSLTVVPFDEPLGVPEALGRRNARNTSSLLIWESHLAAVADPAGGSYAVERLTADLAEAAWAELGRTEEAGGVLAALGDGSLLGRVAAVVERREAEVATRTRPLTGLSEFPNLREELPARAPHPTPRTVRPYGASFEAMRDEPAARPAFLATLGSVASHTARATFASNLLAAGGVDVAVAGPTADVDELLEAYDGQPVVVLAGADTTYAAWGADAARALREAGATRVVLAGKPGERTVDPDLLDDSCAVGVDALAFLTRTREALA
ncbi:methylmalonyl-CoA mutase family protein [Nocardioides perillae]|uniref:Methylmalonyl-CoA mutase n=1 Tax=Nocardioides perillae TaxID=1119534 RepID=A0A7Y9RVX3_9ACTN|nr:methylmalonyl-CoA mutase family protein [Nocardioides perillae]NYG55104.1 methylmalonyl-CoA mutase [Nocardioides perillae]